MEQNAKTRLTEAFLRCLPTKSIEKISVTDVTHECGISRRTFYNYFWDMNDFMFWIHEQCIAQSVESFAQNSDFCDSLSKFLCAIKEHSAFYKKLIRMQGQNSFKEEYKKITIERTCAYFGEHLDENLCFELKLYWQGAIEQIFEWIEDDMPHSVEWMVMRLFESIPPNAKNFYH